MHMVQTDTQQAVLRQTDECQNIFSAPTFQASSLHRRQASLGASEYQVARALSTTRPAAAAHSAIDQKNVSTPDQGDIGRGQHNEVSDGGVLNGDPHQDVVPNMVIPDEHSSKPAGEAGGLDQAIGFKKEAGAGQKPLATPTDVKPVSACVGDHSACLLVVIMCRGHCAIVQCTY